MSNKPWKNEPTLKCETDWNKKMKSVPINDARDIERRMRAAEGLLEKAISAYGLGWITGKMKAHLEAAGKEDGR